MKLSEVEKIKHVSIFVEQTGKGRAGKEWHKERIINIQRLYYIKSGKGYIVDENGSKTEFVKGNIYIFPYNYPQNFVTEPQELIDHFYIDFLSTPPIISSEYLVYEVKENTPLMMLVKLLDEMVEDHNYEKSFYVDPSLKFENIVDAPHGSREEYFQTLYHLIQSLLLMLSGIKEIPFSTDDVVTKALKYINRNYSENIVMEELAKEYGYHVNHFSRRFRAVMGVSPYSYLHTYRIYRATELISKGVSVKKAAELVGYSNPSSLTREIKKSKLQNNL